MTRFPRLRRVSLRAILVVVAVPLLLYIVLMGWHMHSVWRVSRALNQLEAIQLGAPAAQFYEAVRGLSCESDGERYRCYLLPGFYGSDRLVDLPLRVMHVDAPNLRHVGLRFWRFETEAVFKGGAVARLKADTWVDGRHHSLGATWVLNSSVARGPHEESDPEIRDRATRWTWYHISSDISGEGFQFTLTPRASSADRSERRINMQCLLLQRCVNVCDLMPDALQLRKSDGTCMTGYGRQAD